MKQINISVAMATFNGERYIREQIMSILTCLSSADELIISDDGSTDETLSIIQKICAVDERVKLFYGPKSGVVRNFENALNHCTGKCIFLSDQDDVWHENKVKVVLPKLEKYLLVCHNANIFNQETGEIEGDTQSRIGCHKTVFKNIIKNSFIGCCMAFRRELLNVALPFPPPEQIHIHDWWLGLLALKYGNVYFEKNCLINYRIHNSNTLGFKKTNFRFKIKKRINMLKVLQKIKKQEVL